MRTQGFIDDLLAKLASWRLTAAEIGQMRAVEVVEAIGTAEARALLRRWAGGASGAVLTEQARLALGRVVAGL